MFPMGRGQPSIFWKEEEGGGGGGVSKRKTKSCTRREGEKIGTQGSMENVYARWDLYNRNVRKEILIFLILFE